MPQLDVVTFVNQYVWMMGMVSMMMMIMLSIILPSIKKLTQISNMTEEENMELGSEKSFNSFKKLVSF